ncbi:MAG: thioesterase family protein [Myxococcota bacterium]|nr:thioesterase family protein [Myxococcota bacterium]
MAREPLAPPPGARTATVRHRVAFHETDAMGVVHHANYLRHFETARIAWMDAHHRPYRDYVAAGRHWATTRAEIDYHLPARFDDTLDVTTWPAWVRGASLRMAYRLARADGTLLVTGATDHALVDLDGRVRRLDRADRDALQATVGGSGA